jgi:hypothetical protein
MPTLTTANAARNPFVFKAIAKTTDGIPPKNPKNPSTGLHLIATHKLPGLDAGPRAF